MAIAGDELAAAARTTLDVAAPMVVAAAENEAVVGAM
jgi:hypothetical protein